MHFHLEKTRSQIIEHCDLIRDTLAQEQAGSLSWHGLDERLKKYLGPDGLLQRVDKALSPDASSEALQEAIIEVQKYRAWTLDSAEQAIASSSRWKPIRAKLLKYFGPRGIEGLLIERLETILKGGN